MLQVESAVACTGDAGEYRLLLHYLRMRRQAALARLALPGRGRAVERALQLPDIPDPWAVLYLAEAALANQRRRMGRIAVPAITTVERVCDRPTHADGVRTERDSHRIEAATRIIWVPERVMSMVDIRAGTVELNHNSIGHANAVNSAMGLVTPLVSAPLTRAERRYFATSLEAEAVTALPSLGPDDVICAVRHVNERGDPVERVHHQDVSGLL